MFSTALYRQRRAKLTGSIATPILLMGVGEQAANLPMNKLPFRQDSSFWYFTGCDRPHAAVWLEADHAVLFLSSEEDPLWDGETPTFEQLLARYGVDEVRDIEQLPAFIRGRAFLSIAISDERQNRQLTEWTGRSFQFGLHPGDLPLIDAVIAIRRSKTAEEISELREAAQHTSAAHRAVIAATRPDGHENRLAALFHGILEARECRPGYGTILTQAGEVLHQRLHNQPLKKDRLLLLDGGGELIRSGYGADITRTWPVSGKFSPRQRAAYDAVLEANLAAIACCTPGTSYREIHDVACRIISRFLRDEGILRVDEDTAIELGAHAVFFPHGIGHLLGMDVHDLENFGDRPAYPAGKSRSSLFGTCYLRLDLPLEPGWVVTIEPGFYAVPSILHNPQLRERLQHAVDFERAESWLGFGGIRIEDDVVITTGAPEVLTNGVPKIPEAIENLVGSGPSAEERLWAEG